MSDLIDWLKNADTGKKDSGRGEADRVVEYVKDKGCITRSEVES